MDLKALIAKMDQIESKKILNEGFPTVADAKARSEKEKTTGKFDKKEIKPGVTQYTRKSSTFDDGGKDSDQKKAEKKSKKNESFNFKEGGIAHQLLSEFNLAEKVTLPADGSTPNIQTVNGVTQNAPNPWEGSDPAKAAAWANLTPQDQKWLGKADPTDKFILARAPNKGAPAANPTNPSSAAAVNGMDKASDDAAAAAAAKPTPSAAAKPDATSYDSFGNPVAAGSAAATSADPTGMAQAQQDVNKDQAAKPATAAPAAGGKTEWPTDKNSIIAFQKSNGLVPDGLIGAKTMAALQKAGATPPAGFKPVGNKAASGQAGQPAAAASLGGQSFKDASAAANAAGQAAQPAGNPEANQTAATAARTGVAGTAAAGGGRGGQGGPTASQMAQAGSEADKIRAEIDRFKSKNNMAYQANKEYVARLQAKLDAAGGTATAAAPAAGQAAQPAAKPGTGAGLPASVPGSVASMAQQAAGGANPELDRIKQLAGTPKTTTSNQSVQGTIKMGKPEGPITYNGKVVQPGAPEYAAASQALLAAQGNAAQARGQAAKQTTGPVSQGASQARDRDF